MDGIKTVDDLLKAKGLTTEELKLFEDLIREARDREKKSVEMSQLTKENLRKLSDGFAVIAERTYEISKSMDKVLDEMETLYLRSMPESKFQHE